MTNYSPMLSGHTRNTSRVSPNLRRSVRKLFVQRFSARFLGVK